MAETSQTSATQQEEVASLKDTFGKQVKVITNNGEYTSVVDISVKSGVTLKFLLSDAYPMKKPDILVRTASSVSDNVPGLRENLTAFLELEADKMTGQAMLHNLIKQAQQWLCDTCDIYQTADVPEVTQNKEKKKDHKKQKKKPKPTDVADDKKSSMKTAEDVISRIKWDESLPADEFSVGYMDRFLGVMERKFTTFSWEDISAVDNDVLAIPKHRIHYFKYKNVKVWDKNERLDDVFGSTGSKSGIHDVITNYQEPIGIMQQGAAGPDEDDSDDDGVRITLGNKSRDENNEGKHWENKLRPNYFICVSMTDPGIRKEIGTIQEDILDMEPRYKDCIIPQPALHVTICTLGLDTAEQIALARKALQDSQMELSEAAAGVEDICLEGVDNFYNRVLYAKVKENDSFMKFVDQVKSVCRENGVEIRDRYEFVPHMTIMKVTRPTARALRSRDIDPALYAGILDYKFGLQKVDAIHLCSMEEERREDGFYICPQSINFCEEI